jgi:hypothetical protein
VPGENSSDAGKLALIRQNIWFVEQRPRTGSLSPWRERARVRGQKIGTLTSILSRQRLCRNPVHWSYKRLQTVAIIYVETSTLKIPLNPPLKKGGNFLSLLLIPDGPSYYPSLKRGARGDLRATSALRHSLSRERKLKNLLLLINSLAFGYRLRPRRASLCYG